MRQCDMRQCDVVGCEGTQSGGSYQKSRAEREKPTRSIDRNKDCKMHTMHDRSQQQRNKRCDHCVPVPCSQEGPRDERGAERRREIAWLDAATDRRRVAFIFMMRCHFCASMICDVALSLCKTPANEKYARSKAKQSNQPRTNAN